MDSSSNTPKFWDYVQLRPEAAEAPYLSTDIGRVIEFRDDGTVVVQFPLSLCWIGSPDALIILPGPGFACGDSVRFRPGIKPHFADASVPLNAKGIVAAVDGIECLVDFASQKHVPAYLSELQLHGDSAAASDDASDAASGGEAEVPEEGEALPGPPVVVEGAEPKKGDFVRVKRSVVEPEGGWRGLSHEMIGCVIDTDEEGVNVEFKFAQGFQLRPHELDVLSGSGLAPGAYVRFRDGVDPQFGFGAVRPGDVGRVVKHRRMLCTVNFPAQHEVVAMLPELEVVPRPPPFPKDPAIAPGAFVRVKASVDKPRYEWGRVERDDIGYVTACGDAEGLVKVDFPKVGDWTGYIPELERVELEPVSVGDTVRVKASVETPRFDWGNVSPGDVGTVKQVQGVEARVCFPDAEDWMAYLPELEKVPFVRVRRSVDEPAGGWAGVTHDDYGALIEKDSERGVWTVQFPTSDRWRGTGDELEEVEPPQIAIGAAVRFKQGIEPKRGFGRTREGDVGRVVSVAGIECKVDFPVQKGINAFVGELEETEPVEVEWDDGIDVGVYVRVKESVDEPRFDWGGCRRGDIGRVDVVSGAVAQVSFPQSSEWAAYLPELEVVEGFEPLVAGDLVKVKPTVSEPRFKWGSAKHGIAGTIARVQGTKCYISFPGFESEWVGYMPELEKVTYVRLRPGGAKHMAWAGLTHHDIGALVEKDAASGKWVVQLPTCERWRGDPADLEEVSELPVRIGMRVKFRCEPKGGYGPTRPGDVGTVAALAGISCKVDFPVRKGINVPLGVVQPTDEPLPSWDDAIDIGSYVKVKSSVDTPRFNWGNVERGDIGRVQAVEGGLARVAFAEADEWAAFLPEMERVELEPLCIGDTVRVKPSVETPRFKWGSVKPSEIGKVTKVQGVTVQINFPSSSDWTGYLPEIERTAPPPPGMMERMMSGALSLVRWKSPGGGAGSAGSEPGAAQGGPAHAEDKLTCKVCLDAEVNTSLDCGHLYCDGCAKQFENCPICRKPVKDLRKVYFS